MGASITVAVHLAGPWEEAGEQWEARAPLGHLHVACRRRPAVGSESKHRSFSVQGEGDLGLKTAQSSFTQKPRQSHQYLPLASLF